MLFPVCRGGRLPGPAGWGGPYCPCGGGGWVCGGMFCGGPGGIIPDGGIPPKKMNKIRLTKNNNNNNNNNSKYNSTQDTIFASCELVSLIQQCVINKIEKCN